MGDPSDAPPLFQLVEKQPGNPKAQVSANARMLQMQSGSVRCHHRGHGSGGGGADSTRRAGLQRGGFEVSLASFVPKFHPLCSTADCHHSHNSCT